MKPIEIALKIKLKKNDRKHLYLNYLRLCIYSIPFKLLKSLF